jgi:hypothetical protein
MPPTYKKVVPTEIFDGTKAKDFRSLGINLLYIPNVATTVFDDLLKILFSDDNPFKQHSYINPFGTQITPRRFTYATVPDRDFYRYKGKDLVRDTNEPYQKFISSLIKKLMYNNVDPNASVSNAYRYNNKDYIAPHIDDAAFLQTNNCSLWEDPTVFTFTFLFDKPMLYKFKSEKSEGYGITPLHGSLLIQGSIVHEVEPIAGDDKVGRISVTLRTVIQKCEHGSKCTRINCSFNRGPSNYIYYSNNVQ